MSASLDRSLRVWNLGDLHEGVEAECHCMVEGAHNSSIRTLIADFSRNRAASGGEDETIRIWDVGLGRSRDARCLEVLNVPGGGTREILVSFQAALVAAVTRDGSFCLWDVETSEILARVEGHPGALFAAQLEGSSASAAEFQRQPSPGSSQKQYRMHTAQTGGNNWSISPW